MIGAVLAVLLAVAVGVFVFWIVWRIWGSCRVQRSGTYGPRSCAPLPNQSRGLSRGLESFSKFQARERGTALPEQRRRPVVLCRGRRRNGLAFVEILAG